MLKRLLLSTILLFLVLATMGQSATIDKIRYEVISPTEVALVDGINAEGKVVIPECVKIKKKRYVVTCIRDGAFISCKKLTKVLVPNSVISIGNNVFRFCESLKSITISEKITKIGNFTFSGCYSLTNISIPNNVSMIGEFAFSNCHALTHIIVPNHVVSIGKNAFYNCHSLKEILNHNKEYPEWIINDIISHPNNYGEELNVWAKTQIGEKSVINYIELSIQNGNISQLPTTEEFVKSKVEQDINEWQKKGEFESTAKWRIRVNEATRNTKARELAQKYKDEYVILQEKQKKEYKTIIQKFYTIKEEKQKAKFNANLLKLSTYDADNESFMIKSSCEDFADILLPVKVEDAPSFKANWEDIKLSAMLSYVPNGDDVALTAVTFKDGDKTYTYDNNTKAKYALTEIDYNFKPIELTMVEDSNFNYSFNPIEEMKQRVVTTPEKGISKRQQNVFVERKKLSIGDLSDVDINIPNNTQSANNTFAIIIGNENYNQVSKVSYALNDSQIFATYCHKTLGLPQKNIKIYTDATFGIMLSAVDNIKNIAKAYKEDINVIFYYAGHGIPNEENKDAFLLPVDADARNTAACYSIKKLYDELAGLNSKGVTIFMDACFSGAQRGDGMLTSARSVAIKPRDVEPTGNMVVFSAASADETAYPYVEKGHGLFTYFLLKKLQESKGNVTLGELGTYICEKVMQESIVSNGKSQTPTVVSSVLLRDKWKNMKLK